MNRIILIGNGFDLAHGMKTKYSDFIDGFWQKEIQKVKENYPSPYEDEFIKLDPSHFSGQKIDNYKTLVKNSRRFKFKNEFLGNLAIRHENANWLDIENEYYLNLKECLKKPILHKIDKLNSEFEAIKREFKEYIHRIDKGFNKKSQRDIVKSKIAFRIFEDFNFEDFSERYISGIVDYVLKRIENDLEISRTGGGMYEALKEEEKRLIVQLIDSFDYRKDLRKILIEKNNIKDFIGLNPDNILLLNFNYTSTAENYNYPLYNKNDVSLECLYIHGKLSHPENEIIFGYGDELDRDYREIEEINENEYLKNIKSVKYLERSAYKDLLRFINSDVYQVCIMGHSCGNSDRTLLNTLFEHENCVSVKPYYRKRKDGTDNFSEIAMNISRNFKDKALMRDVVVDKSRTEALFD